MKQSIQFPDGRQVLNLGQGTWRLGEDAAKYDQEVAALRSGIESGLTLIDTAEMYGDGKSEELVGDAIAAYQREDLFIVSKVYPHHAGRSAIFDACEQTLQRLGIDSLDLYLLHWRGSVPLQETVDCFEELKQQGKIKGWGVSNFDLEDMEELLSVNGGDQCQTNQVLYHLASRGTEVALQDYLKERNIPMMAYCPVIGQEPQLKERVYNDQTVQAIAKAHGISIIQLLLAFVLQKENIIAIPKASTEKHVQLNADMLTMQLTEEEIKKLDAAFPVPDHRVPLSVQ
ncbi:aldo/keto reductase [Marinilactibacillus kalidii]|uniref:aldo/keto reductase n=1 Tax=Marinilactibacillus kalidii TaxID=2820274 RepID=UPI001FCA293F|nr:aldo/keto reductase [Marinilactibacillus kalidii]